MTKQERFHSQLINSFVVHTTSTKVDQFLIRSELLRRTNEFPGSLSEATAAIFFDSDMQAYNDQLAVASEDPWKIYSFTTLPFGSTTIMAIG